MTTISASDGITFPRIIDVLNKVFNCSHKSFLKATWFPNGRNGRNVVWFPKLSLPNGKPVAYEWGNYFFEGNLNFICQRRMLTIEEKKEEPLICEGNKSHYNNPLDCIKANQPIPPFSSDTCNIIGDKVHWHSKTHAVFAKVNNEYYKFFGIYKFIGIQTMEQYEEITRDYPTNTHRIKNKYIEVYKKISEELKISEWV